MCIERKITAKTALLEVARQFDETEMVGFLERIGADEAPSREKIRELARPGKTGKSSLKNSPLASEPVTGRFIYSSPTDEFEIEIRFKKGGSHSRRGVLKALKETFDEVKNENIDV
jgi:hypothetical protein